MILKEKLLEIIDFKLIVKEVGQGFGPASIRRLMQLPLAAIEFGAFGGTNFAQVELARCDPQKQELYRPLAMVGHTADEMLNVINVLERDGNPLACRQLIISGGIRSFLDGYYYISKSSLTSVFGQASGFLRFARGEYSDLQRFVNEQVNGLKLAGAFLRIKT